MSNYRYRFLALTFAALFVLPSCSLLRFCRAVNTPACGAADVCHLNIIAGDIPELVDYKDADANSFYINVDNKKSFEKYMFYDNSTLSYVSPYGQDPKGIIVVYVAKLDAKRHVDLVIKVDMLRTYEDKDHVCYSMKKHEVVSQESYRKMLGRRPSNKAMNADK